MAAETTRTRGTESAVIQDAVRDALIDSVLMLGVEAEMKRTGRTDLEAWGEFGDRLRAEWKADIYRLPSELLAGMDPVALGQNVSVRLLGPAPLGARVN